MSESIIPTKPYLIRAIRLWSQDNGLTPQILVDASVEGVNVPPGFVRDGQIVLNIHDQAVQSLSLANDWICFSARFNGVSHSIDVPVDAVLAIYARENGQGIFFQQTGQDAESPGSAEGKSTVAKPAPGPGKKKSHLKLVH